MRLKSKMSAVASLVAVTALSIQGMSPTAATEPDGVEEPTSAAATSPAEVSAPATAEPEGVEALVEPEAPKLLDLTFGQKTTPIRLGALKLPLNLGSIDLNPQAAPATTDPRFGGSASGITAEISVAGLVKLKTTKLGAIGMDPDGETTERTAAVVQLPALPAPLPDLNILSGGARGITVKTWGYESYPDKLPTAVAHSDVADFGANILFTTHVAKGVKAIAIVKRLANGQYEFTGRSLFDSVSLAGLVNHDSQEVAPNTTVAVPGLGKVVLNEQKITQIPGDRRGIEVHAIHIMLDTATFGLPVGADIYVGSAEAILYE